MNDALKPLARGLTYAGGLPFAALAGLATARAAPWGLDPVAALRAYSLAIAAFMAGTIWGYVLPQARGGGALFLLFSNALALAAFFAALAASSRVALGFDLATFLALLAVDFRAARRGWLDADYLRLRTRITAVVALALGAVLGFAK